MKKRTLSLIALNLTAAMMLTAGAAGLNTVFGSNHALASESASDTDSTESDLFTSRDLEIGYDEETSAVITLTGDTASSSSDAVEISGSTVTIKDEGTYILSGSLEDGMILIDADNTDKIQLVLNGVSIANADSAAIYIRSADKVFITTASGTENTLSNGGEYNAIDDNNIDAVIFSKDDLTLNGSGTLIIRASAGHGIVSKDDLALTSGIYEITAAEHGLSGKDSVRIANGSYTITSGEDAIHSENDDDSTLGFVYISGGSFTISAGDDGIHAGSSVQIEDGTINITESNEGIEGLSIDINGGEISLVSTDDGLNAAGGTSSEQAGGFGGDIFAVTEGAYINITGGILNVKASGDGIDSNGDLMISGGEIYVSGPEMGANGSLDYNGTATITGGIFAAAGASGMNQNFGTDSTQGAFLTNVANASAGTEITLSDESGNVLFSWIPDSSYSSVLISIPELTEGSTYTLTTDGTSTEITMDSLIYGSQGGFGGMGGFGRNDQNGGRMKGGNFPNNGEMPDASNLPDDAQMPQDGSFPGNGEMPDASNLPDGAQIPQDGSFPNQENNSDSADNGTDSSGNEQDESSASDSQSSSIL